MWLFSELASSAGQEVRNIEVFEDGTFGWATERGWFGSTRLGAEPVPLLNEISRDTQFDAREITREEFEDMWSSPGAGIMTPPRGV